MTWKGALTLFETLRTCKSVVSNLYLNKIHVDEEFIKQVGEYLQDNPFLELLYIENAKLTDKSVEILSGYCKGNSMLKELYLHNNETVTDASVPFLVEMAKRSSIHAVFLVDTSISEENKEEIIRLLDIPLDQRELPIKSNTKSASKLFTSRST